MQNILTITREAGADLSSHQFRAVKATADNKVDVAGAGDRVLGVISNKPTLGLGAAVQVLGVAKVEAGAAVAVGDLLKADANGKAIPVAAGIGTKEEVFGVALEAASADTEIIAVLIRPQTLTTET